jgi:PKD repeat protein
MFVSPLAGDWRLAPGSPLIDAGTPGTTLAAGEFATDLAGNPRIVHGRRDAGAYEYGWRGPTVSASAAPVSAKTGALISFSAVASAQEPGDTVASYAWSFDDGSAASGQAVSHAFAKPGAHSATVTATDALGVTASAAVGVTVTAASSKTTLPNIGSPLSALKLTPARFRAARKGASIASRGAIGSHITYTLSAKALVKFSVRRVARGVRHGKACVAPRRGLHGKGCRRTVALRPTFSRLSKAGANSRYFSGRVGGHALHPGSYVLVATVGHTARTVSFTIIP